MFSFDNNWLVRLLRRFQILLLSVPPRNDVTVATACAALRAAPQECDHVIARRNAESGTWNRRSNLTIQALRKLKFEILLLAVLATGLIGCANAITPADLSQTIVVQGYLWANHPVDSIVLSKTVPIDAYYDPSQARITGATVTINVDNHVYKLTERPGSPGVYELPADSLIIRSEKKYDLTVHALGTVATASTIVPDTFVLTKLLPDTIQFPADLNQAGTMPHVEWSESANRIYYGLSMEALDTLVYQVKGADTVWNQRVGTNQGIMDPRRIRAQQLVRYELLLKAPQADIAWNIFRWYGRHRLTVFAMDSNFVEFMIMQSAGRQYFPQLNQITNGIGVFGSAALQQQVVFVKE